MKYDLIGKIAEGTQLTRRTTADYPEGISVAVFAQFRTNPESFIAEAVRLINGAEGNDDHRTLGLTLSRTV